jgi:uncharacterized protein (TIGR02302 family)
MILPEQPDDAVIPLLNRLRRKRLLARAVLVFEAILPAIWPALGIAGSFVVLALLDLPRRLPAVAHTGLIVAAAIAIVALLVRGFWGWRWPDHQAVDRRLERASGLRHRPLAAIADRPAVGRGAITLWTAHIARAASQLKNLRIGMPRPGLAARDPRALRAALLIALIASLTIAGEQAPGRLIRALQPPTTQAAIAPTLQIQAWITPPDYTGMAPIFLRQDSGAVSAPAGALLTANVTGTPSEVQLIQDGATTLFKTLDPTSHQVETTLKASGAIQIRIAGRTTASWDIAVVADVAPEVQFPEPPGFQRGRPPMARLPWQVSHAYGVASLQAELRLHDRPGKAAPLIVAVPLPAVAPKSAKGVRLQDLTAHPWAGLRVDAGLVATSVSGLVGTSTDVMFALPERSFQHPVARALVAIRKLLVLDPDQRAPALLELDRLTGLNDVWRDDSAGFLNLRAIIALLRGREDGVVDQAQPRIWALILHLEDGAPERTARELDRADKALQAALEAEKRDEKTDPADIEKLTKDLQDALQRHLQALADQARRDPDTNQFNPDDHKLDAKDMKRLAEQMRDAARDGRLDEERQKLAELEKMLEEMKNGRPERGKMTEREKQRAEQREKGQQQMSLLGDVVKREGTLLDRSQARADAVLAQARRPQFARPFGPQPPTPEQLAQQQDARAADRSKDEQIQLALRRVLGELMARQADLTGDVPANLADADTAMRDAMAALAESGDASAAGAQQRTIEALQKGGQQMSQQLAQQFGSADQDGDGDDGNSEGQGTGMADGQDGQDGQGDGIGNGDNGNQYGPGNGQNRRTGRNGRSFDRRADDRRDPLGRTLKNGTGGRDDGSDVKVPDEMELARTREIQDELRRRSGERSRPQPELDYLERLLRQF